jgi:hypothetical protein
MAALSSRTADLGGADLRPGQLQRIANAPDRRSALRRPGTPDSSLDLSGDFYELTNFNQASVVGGQLPMKTIRVSVTDPRPSDEILARFDDAQEQLFGKLLREHSGIAKFSEHGQTSTRFDVHVAATRHLGTVTTLIRRTLRHHHVEEHVTIERV